MPEADVLIDVRGLCKQFPVQASASKRRGSVRAVEDMSFQIRRGEVLALVGESGSGKSTVGRLLLRLLEPSAGHVDFEGIDLPTLSRSRMRAFRRRMQMIFQDPFAALNPFMSVRTMLEEALVIHGIGRRGADREARVAALLESVGLPSSAAERFPHEFSGGQRQRLCIARALAVEPDFIVADEAISALDVSNQAQIVNILLDLKASKAHTMLFISHNLAVVRSIADRVAVMYLGRLVEVAPAEVLFATPGHPYTAALLGAIPIPDTSVRRERVVLQDDLPSALSPPSGCVFRTRCPHAITICAEQVPPLRSVGDGHTVACIRYDELKRAVVSIVDAREAR